MIVTKAEFARMVGVTRGAVTRWAKDGRIVLEGDRVVVEASLRRLEETGGARPDVAARHASARARPAAPEAAVGHEEEEGRGGSAAAAARMAPGVMDAERIGSSYQAARAVREKYAALQAKLAYEQSLGNLIPKEEVDAALRALGASVRARLDVLADQLAPVVAPATDLDEVHALLSEHFRAVLAGIADDMARHGAEASA